MRIAIALCAGWIVGGMMLARYFATHSFPGYLCPVAATLVTLIVMVSLPRRV